MKINVTNPYHVVVVLLGFLLEVGLLLKLYVKLVQLVVTPVGSVQVFLNIYRFLKCNFVLRKLVRPGCVYILEYERGVGGRLIKEKYKIKYECKWVGGEVLWSSWNFVAEFWGGLW